MAKAFRRLLPSGKRTKSYWAKFEVGGKAVFRSLKTTDQRDAQVRLARLLEDERSRHQGRPSRNLELDDFMERFLQRYKHQDRRKNTNHYRRAFRELRRMKNIGRLDQITPELLQAAKERWQADKRGLYVINKDIQCIKALMHTAEGWKMVPSQNWAMVKRLKEPRGRLLWYSTQELKRLSRVCKAHWQRRLRMGSGCGLRPGEGHWLTWDDIDYERKRCHIVGKNVAGESWEPKDFERRWIPMSDNLIAFMKREQTKSVGPWVMADERGNRIAQGVEEAYWRKLVKKAGLKGSLTTLRHTYGAHTISSGKVSLYQLKELMGHNSIRTTEIYAHLMPDVQQRASDHAPRY